MCAIRLAQYFSKFITKPIGVSFLIIKIDAYRLGSVSQPLTMWFLAVGLIGLVGLKH